MLFYDDMSEFLFNSWFAVDEHIITSFVITLTFVVFVLNNWIDGKIIVKLLFSIVYADLAG